MKNNFTIYFITLTAVLFATSALGQSSPTQNSSTTIQASVANSEGNSTVKPEASAPDPKDPHAWMWIYQMPSFSDKDYKAAVDALLADYEKRLGKKLEPGAKRHAGIKVMTGTVGLSTPTGLVRAVIAALEARGFKADELFIVDQSEDRMHDAGFLPLNAPTGEGTFDGAQVIALERGRYFNLKWSYESNVPPSDWGQQQLDQKRLGWTSAPTERQSLLPVPLLLDVDFWINLPVGADEGDFGMAGALVNATLFASSNTQRFLDNPGTGSKAVADMAAVPELQRGWVLTLMSLERYQYIGGPKFNALYTQSRPQLWMSPNAVMLDKMLFDAVEQAREDNRLPKEQTPAYIDYARLPDMHLGDDDPKKMYLVKLP